VTDESGDTHTSCDGLIDRHICHITDMTCNTNMQMHDADMFDDTHVT